jgi:hypothetical protein
MPENGYNYESAPLSGECETDNSLRSFLVLLSSLLTHPYQNEELQ